MLRRKPKSIRIMLRTIRQICIQSNDLLDLGIFSLWRPLSSKWWLTLALSLSLSLLVSLVSSVFVRS